MIKHTLEIERHETYTCRLVYECKTGSAPAQWVIERKGHDGQLTTRTTYATEHEAYQAWGGE